MPILPPYRPDDSRISVATLEFLHGSAGEKLRDQVSELLAVTAEPSVSEVARLRANFPAEAVHAALAMGKLQPRARAKFPELAGEYIWALPEALEQATDAAVARHKAGRFAALAPGRIFDFCAGIGGDSRALAQVAAVTAVDLSAPRLQCLHYNSINQPPLHAITRQVADIASTVWETQGGLFHVDPSRRTGGKRSAAFEDLIPGPAVLGKLMEVFEGGAIKMSSATDFEALPNGHLELISHAGVVVQAVLWVGRMAELFPAGSRTATVIVNHEVAMSYTDVPGVDGGEEPGDMLAFRGILYEVDGAISRANLAKNMAKKLGLRAITSHSGYFLGDVSAPPAPPYCAGLTAFQVLRMIQYSEKRVVEALAEVSAEGVAAGAPEVKTRGKIAGVDTDRLQVLLGKRTGRRFTVLIFRHGGENYAAIARRIRGAR